MLFDKAIASAMVVALLILVATIVTEALPSRADNIAVPFLAVSTLVVVLRATRRRRPDSAHEVKSY